MMAETSVQTLACEACGADVRDESLFCYSCGERVRQELPAVEPVLPGKEIVAEPASRPPLKSAASLRKQRRAYNRQPVEISWEQRTRSPIAFILTTVVLTIGALVLLLIALYLR